MIALALICLLVAAAAVVFIVVLGFDQNVAFSFFAGDFVTRPVWVFLGGAVTLLLAEAALALFRRGTRRKVAQRREIKRLRKVETSVADETQTGRSTEHGHASGTTGSESDRGSGPDRGSDRDRGADRSDGGASAAGADETLIREPRRDPDQTRNS